MSIPYENVRRAVADRAMGVLVWVLRLGGLPAQKATPSAKPAEPWKGKRHAAGPAEVRVLTADEPLAAPPASTYCGFCGEHCHCKPVTTGGIA